MSQQADEDEDDVTTPEPIWLGGSEVVATLDAVLKHPLTHPDLYDDDLLPVRRLVAVWAPSGSGKLTALCEYCQTISIHYGVVSASHETHTIRAQLCGLHSGVRIVIITHADDLVARFTFHKEYALTLDRLARDREVIFVCLFDRVLNDGAFLEQFESANVYFPPPNSTFLDGYLRYWMDRYQRRYAPHVSISLSEGDYIALATCHTLLAPVSAVRKWVRSLFYPAVAASEHNTLCVITMSELTSPPYMTLTAKGGGDPYILHRDPRTGLNEFSTVAGLGLVHVAPKPRVQPKKVDSPQENQGENQEGEDPESATKRARITIETTETVNGDYVPRDGGDIMPLE